MDEWVDQIDDGQIRQMMDGWVDQIDEDEWVDQIDDDIIT